MFMVRTRDDLDALLRRDGFSLKEFDHTKCKGKDSFALTKEIRERAAIAIWDSVRQRIIRHALSVQLLVECRGMCLVEAVKRYKNGTLLDLPGTWTVKGTRVRGETVKETAWREFIEEYQQNIRMEDIVERHMPDEVDEHESSAYFHMLSHTLTQYCALRTSPEFWGTDNDWQDPVIIRETDSDAVAEWRPYERVKGAAELLDHCFGTSWRPR